MAVTWSSASHYGLGVPYDLVQRARKHGGQAAIDLENMVRINCRRSLFIGSISGLWIIGFVFFVLTGLAILGFYYWVQFAQAIFLIALPISIVGALSLSLARMIIDQDISGDDLFKKLIRHRVIVQGIGILSIFVTAMWGMYQNLTIGFAFG